MHSTTFSLTILGYGQIAWSEETPAVTLFSQNRRLTQSIRENAYVIERLNVTSPDQVLSVSTACYDIGGLRWDHLAWSSNIAEAVISVQSRTPDSSSSMCHCRIQDYIKVGSVSVNLVQIRTWESHGVIWRQIVTNARVARSKRRN